MKKWIMAAAVISAAAVFSACGGQSREDIPAQSEDVSSVSEAAESVTSAVSDAAAGQESVTEAVGRVSCSDITAAIMEQVEMSSMAEVDSERLSIYLDCPVPADSDFSMYICGSGGFADEVFVVDCGDSSEEYIAAAEKRIESRKNDFEGYNPDEYDKLDNCYSEFRNGYFIYAVSSDSSKCEEIFGSFVK